jgi:formylglycine-generating enzyme required for sulfatase activity
MSGNVSEWCFDWEGYNRYSLGGHYLSGVTNSIDDDTDPRIIERLQVGYKDYNPDPRSQDTYYGFRVVRKLPNSPDDVADETPI